MTVEGSPGQIYQLARPHLDAALRSYKDITQQGLKNEISDYYVSGRVKTARSLIRKLRKEIGNPRSWESIQDKVGIRVICSTKSDLKRAAKWLDGSGWNVVERAVKTADHDRLFYPGIHYIVENNSIVDHTGAVIPCEIQLRTRAQDAWSVVSHRLLYKGLIEPPSKMKRAITRLTVVVEMFDDEVHRMMKRRKRLPAYRPALMLEALDEQYETLTGEPSGGLPDIDIMQVLMNSYSAPDIDSFDSILKGFVQSKEQELAALIKKHQPDADTYVDSRDWLYTQPEVLCVLERAASAPYLLLHAIQDTDLEDVVRRTCVAAGNQLPNVGP